MIKKEWTEFRNAGLLWFVNTILHMFGWAICLEFDEENKQVIDAYPARVKFRGFTEELNTNGYIAVSQWMKDNAIDLLKEAKD